MSSNGNPAARPLPKGVMFNAYPDSIGGTLADIFSMLGRQEFHDAFSLFYVLPTFFNSDLDRGFSVIDYDLNEELVSRDDLGKCKALDIQFKFDLVLNHLSVGSPQFKDMLENGDDSRYRHFFIDWNEFWEGNGEMGPDGYILPAREHLQKLFMRKPELPILKVRFPDGSFRPYWNTFYQEVRFSHLSADDLTAIDGISSEQARGMAAKINQAIDEDRNPVDLDFDIPGELISKVLDVVESRRTYLGQMDLNANSEIVWEFYDETLGKLGDYGARLVRMDAFAYLHKAVGETNFFNKPGTWEYLDRLKGLARKHGLVLLPEIHSEYGSGLHEEVAENGFPIYDFFLPGLVIHALDCGTNQPLLRWYGEVLDRNLKTINMLGCHDGIPVLDLRGKEVDGAWRDGLLGDNEIEAVIDTIIERGGRIKNLYGANGKKIAYYQVNASYFSALGEDEQKLLLARAIQLFTPGIPQVWYLDLFAGRNDYAAADRGNTGGHKEINRTGLTMQDVDEGLAKPVVQQQLEMMRLRNTSPAFDGVLEMADTEPHLLHLTWRNGECWATLEADLRTHAFAITHIDKDGRQERMDFAREPGNDKAD